MTSFHKENIRKICICFNQSKTLREQSSHGEATISLGYVIFTLGTTPIEEAPHYLTILHYHMKMYYTYPFAYNTPVPEAFTTM